MIFLGIANSIKKAFGANKESVEKGNAKDEQKGVQAKYPYETCALCNQPACDVKWGGQYWHKKCLRSMRKAASTML